MKWAAWILLLVSSVSFFQLHGHAVAQNVTGNIGAPPPARSTPLPTASFIFGDSLVDAGNNNYIGSLARANYGANGVDFPGGPKATGRFCNGRTVADIIGKLGNFGP